MLRRRYYLVSCVAEMFKFVRSVLMCLSLEVVPCIPGMCENCPFLLHTPRKHKPREIIYRRLLFVLGCRLLNAVCFPAGRVLVSREVWASRWVVASLRTCPNVTSKAATCWYFRGSGKF